MRIILKLINLKNLIYLFFLLILHTYSLNLYSSENRIIFKINDSAFTSLDLENRLNYLDFVGGNQNLELNVSSRQKTHSKVFEGFWYAIVKATTLLLGLAEYK